MNKFYNPDTMPPPASRYRQVAEIPGGSKLVVLSGQVGMRLDGTVPDDFEGQAAQASCRIRPPETKNTPEASGANR